jgi:hypothetical protein
MGVAGLGYLAWSSQTQAQPRDPVGAEALFRSGKELLKAGDWAHACEKFQKSMDLDPAVSTQVKLAKCREHEGRLATAWYEYQRALKLNRESDQGERRKQELAEFIQARIAELEPNVPKLRVTVPEPPQDLVVERDGQPLPLAALSEPLPIDPGKHRLEARAPGYVSTTQEFELAAGQLFQAELILKRDPHATITPSSPPMGTLPGGEASPRETTPLGSTSSAPKGSADTPPDALDPSFAPATPPTTDASRPKGTGNTARWLGITVGGAGLVTLGVAGYYGLKTRSLVGKMNDHCPTLDDCDDQGVRYHDRAATAQTVGFVLLGIGATALGTGIVLYATAPSPGSHQATLPDVNSADVTSRAPTAAAAHHRDLAVVVHPGFVAVQGSL